MMVSILAILSILGQVGFFGLKVYPRLRKVATWSRTIFAGFPSSLGVGVG